MFRCLRAAAASATFAASAMWSAPQAIAQTTIQTTTLRVVMHSDLKILDPIWSGAYIVRQHGYMVYDTLFAIDHRFAAQPQMAEGYTVSADGLTYTIKLRDGLTWHDHTPVTAEDCVASLKRWAARDSMGQKLAKSTSEWRVVDAKSFAARGIYDRTEDGARMVTPSAAILAR